MLIGKKYNPKKKYIIITYIKYWSKKGPVIPFKKFPISKYKLITNGLFFFKNSKNLIRFSFKAVRLKNKTKEKKNFPSNI